MKPQAIVKNIVAVEGRALSQALKPILRVIEKRNTYPILATVRLCVSGAALTITGTDLDIQITARLDVNEASGEWSSCLNPHLLARIARLAGPALVRIELATKLSDGLKPSIDHDAIVTVGDDARYVLRHLPADAWPELAGERGDLIERFGNGSLATHLGKVSRYISGEETRYYLNGVCWQMGNNGRRFVATDGHRLGVCRYDADAGTQREDMIIPRKAVALLLTLAKGQDVATYAVTGKPMIEATIGPVTVRTKLIEGTFPDVNRVTPRRGDANHALVMNRQEVLSALDMAVIMSSDRGGRAVKFYGDDDALHLSATNFDAGEAKVRTRVAWPGGCSDFGLNATYIRGIVLDCEGEVTMHVKDAASPFLVTDEDETMTRVLMPMRV